MKNSSPETLITTNTFFRKIDKFPWHPGDHVVCGTSRNLKNIFEKSLNVCLNGGYFDPNDAERFIGDDETGIHKEFGFHLVRPGDKKRWDEMSISYPTVVPEQMIGASHILLNHDGPVDFKQYEDIMKKYFDVVPVDDLGYVMISRSESTKNRIFEIANTTKISRDERRLSIEKSMDEVKSSSQTIAEEK